MIDPDGSPESIDATPPRGERGQFVAFSEITVPVAGRQALDDAFRNRLGAVDQWPGFCGLQVWAAPDDPTRVVMVSWWDSADAFATYMGSTDHRRSHRRIPRDENRPRPGTFSRYEVIAQ